MSTSFYGWFTAGINDEQTSASTTWSSEKISEELAKSVTPDEVKAAVGKIKIIGTDGKTYLGVITAVSGKPVFEYEEYVEVTENGAV